MTHQGQLLLAFTYLEGKKIWAHCVFKCNFTVTLLILEKIQNLEGIILGISLCFGSFSHVFLCDLFVAGLNPTLVSQPALVPITVLSPVKLTWEHSPWVASYSRGGWCCPEQKNMELAWSVAQLYSLVWTAAQLYSLCSMMLAHALPHPYGSVTVLWYLAGHKRPALLFRGAERR